MVHIKIKKGLNIPIKGHPQGPVREMGVSPQIGLDLTGFENVKLRLLANVDEKVKIGQSLAEDKSTPGRFFVSPAGGVIKEIRRGAKRVLQAIVIEVQPNEAFFEYPPCDPKHAQKELIIERMLACGCFTRIRQRPFNLLAEPYSAPKSIFVKAIESAPYVPDPRMQVAGHEKEFQAGLDALSRLTEGAVHLVYPENSNCRAFTEAQSVQRHTAEGPHPIGTFSLHIQEIDPIVASDEVIWTLSVLDVIAIGYALTKGHLFNERIIAIAGPGILSDRTGYFKVRDGQSITSLLAGRIGPGEARFISGDPLMGSKVTSDDFLGFDDTVFCVIPENTKRSFLHFLRLGLNKFSFSKAYLSGHLDTTKREFDFTTSQHGEHRPFIDSSLYDRVMPLDVPTMLLVKAVMAKDFELAQTLGLLEVDKEDFALPTFVCPSKINMTEIIGNGIKEFAKEMGR